MDHRTVTRRRDGLASGASGLQPSIPVNPARRLPRPKVAKTVPVCSSAEMAHKLIAAADRPWTKALVVLRLTTGVRRAEAAGITLDDLDLERRRLPVRGKGSKERVVPLAEQAVEAIREYLAHRIETESRHLLVSARAEHRGRPIHPRVVNAASVRTSQPCESALPIRTRRGSPSSLSRVIGHGCCASYCDGPLSSPQNLSAGRVRIS